LSGFFSRLEDVPISEEQIKKAQELLQFDEERRQEKMREYYEQKLQATKSGSSPKSDHRFTGKSAQQ
jgi:hypothetical protein